MGSEYYPPQDEVSGNDILQAQAHAEAQREEEYVHGVAAFRGQFFNKLAAHGALSEDLGWAVFGTEQDDDYEGAETVPQREVLLFCINRPGVAHQNHPVPLIRIITNEPFMTEDGLTYLTEDVTILESGRASYFMGAVRSRDTDGEFVDDVVHSASPLFFVSAEDNKLIVTTNAGRFTPHAMLQDESLPDDRVFPYGPATGDNMEDYVYALGRAQDILQTVLADEPSHAYGRVA